MGDQPGVAPELALSSKELAERYQKLMQRIEDQAALNDNVLDDIVRGVPELMTTVMQGLE